MGGQAIERREMMRLLAMASVAGHFPGFCRWAFAFCPESSARQRSEAPAGYRPLFFNSHEYAVIESLASLILPSDETPGAREAGVSEFIDFMVFHDADVQVRFRYGITWLEAHAQSQWGRPFLELKPEEQQQALEGLAYRDHFRPGAEEGRAFFQLVRDYTVMGFYTSRLGLEQLDFPGLDTFHLKLPGCPHRDDPEHRSLEREERQADA